MDGHTREMQISDRELCAFDVDGQVDLAATRQILDVAVPAMLRAARDRPGTFFPDLGLRLLVGGTGVDVLWLRWLGDHAGERSGRDQLGLPLVPLGEDLGRWSTAEDSRVDEAGETNAGNVSR